MAKAHWIEEKDKKTPNYTVGEEIFNSVSHGVGALLSLAALILGVIWASLYGDGWCIASAIIYGLSLMVLYDMSTFYHAIPNKRAKRVLRIFDHCSIFVLIAGTYTPYTLVALRGPLGYGLFTAVWAVTILGIVLNAISIERFQIFSMICYVAMGWIVIFAYAPLKAALPMPGLLLLIAGGVVYTLGLLFFGMKKRYAHSVWHLFVLTGSILHFLSVLLYVFPGP